uniref:gustatory receptor for sugar taste 43a-like n=1 Tax=Vespula vulgaris TaxID=7454 RepID=UPI00223B8A5E|nr:gustatory receptor for sugar taste 43a-like [Vespula vulgaris]
MVEFLLVIEFLTVVRCIKSEFQRANELLSDDNILPISSITLQLIEHKGIEGSFSTERSLLVDSKKLFIVAPSLRQTQSRLQIARHKINRIKKLLRTIRQIHLELYRVSRSVSHMYGIPISLEIAMLSGLYVGETLWLSDTKLLSKIDNSVIIMVYCINFNPVIIMIITDFTFVFWIRYIKIKFVQLNAVLQSMLITTIDSPQHKRVFRMKNNWEDDSSLSTHYGTYKAYENLAKLKRIKQIHLELMKCASIANEAYGLQIFISILTSVLFITTALYNAFVTLTTNNYYNCMIQFYTHSYWIFYCFFKVFAITNICQTTITEIREFMYQLIQNRLKFTACGFYDLDHTLIYNAIGTIITYLVILLQVGDKPKAFFNNAIHNSTSTI